VGVRIAHTYTHANTHTCTHTHTHACAHIHTRTTVNRSHVLRVENGQAKLGTNMGLSVADFEHASTAAEAPASSTNDSRCVCVCVQQRGAHEEVY
jgi:thiamine phosphate synthase YjbQ (UPF0047 family)